MENSGICPNCGNNQILPDNLTKGFCSECGSVIFAKPISQPVIQDIDTGSPSQNYAPPPQDSWQQQQNNQQIPDEQQQYAQPIYNAEASAQIAPAQSYPPQYSSPQPPESAYGAFTNDPISQQTPSYEAYPHDPISQEPPPYSPPPPQQEPPYAAYPHDPISQEPSPYSPPPPQQTPTYAAYPHNPISQEPPPYSVPPQQNQPYEAYSHGPASQEPPPYSPTPPQKTRKPIPKIAYIIAAAVVVVVVAAILFVPALAGNSYERAEGNFLGRFTSVLGGSSLKNNAVDFTVQYTPGRDFDELVPDITASGAFSYAENQAVGSLVFSSSDFDPLSLLLGYDGSELTILFPEISDYYLSLIAQLDDDVAVDMSELDQKKLAATIDNIIKIYNKTIKDDLQIEKNVELTGGNVNIKCDKYSIVFTQELIGRMLLDVVKEVRKNTNLMGFISNLLTDSGYDVEDILYDLEDMAEDMDDTTRLFRMQVWIDSNKVVARTIDRIQGSDIELSYQYLYTNKSIYIDVRFRDKNTEYLRLKGSIDKVGNAWNGKVDLTIKDYNSWYGEEETLFAMTVRLENIKKSGSIITGDVRITGDYDDGYGSFNFKAALDKQGSSQTIKLSGNVSDSYDQYDIGELFITYTLKSVKSVSPQRTDDSYAVYLNDYSASNASNAEDMAADVRNYYDSNDEGLFGDILYSLWDMIDDISYYSNGRSTSSSASMWGESTPSAYPETSPAPSAPPDMRYG